MVVESRIMPAPRDHNPDMLIWALALEACRYRDWIGGPNGSGRVGKHFGDKFKGR